MNYPETLHQSADLIDLEPPSTPPCKTSAVMASNNLIDFDASVTNRQPPPTDLNTILEATGLSEMSEIGKLLR